MDLARMENHGTAAVFHAGRFAERKRSMAAENTAGNEVLCGANSYTQKYYLNPKFASLPEGIRNELQILCVKITEECGGILTLEFDEEGELNFLTRTEDGDYLFDDISSGMEIFHARIEKQELLSQLELYYKVRFLGKKDAAE